GKVWRLPCLVMEKINGQTLAEILVAHPQGCSTQWVINWLEQATDILWELHRKNIIHRDIKPSNLMLRENGQLVMIDFGGAKQIDPTWQNYTASPLNTSANNSINSHRPAEKIDKGSTRLFSPGYSPPEQVRGKEVGPYTDFYALGRTFIHLLTGKPPWDLEDPLTGEMRWRHLVNINADLADLLTDLVNVNTNRRPQTAAEIQLRLAKIKRQEKRSHSATRFVKLRRFSQIFINYVSLTPVAILTKILPQLFSLCLTIAIQLLQGSLDTIWAMFSAGCSTGMGAILGFILAYWLPVGDRLANWLQTLLPDLSNLPVQITGGIIILVLAGGGYGLGLANARSFQQKGFVFSATIFGILGFLVGWLNWHIMANLLNIYRSPDDLIFLDLFQKLSVGIATGLPILGLGLPERRFLQAGIVCLLTAIAFGLAQAYHVLPINYLQFFTLSITKPTFSQFLANVGFLTLLSLVGSLSLGLSHYGILPILKGKRQ
ncbi:MAG: serine/threonine protein kinase, partial [Microcoleaceae cyanobacterium]